MNLDLVLWILAFVLFVIAGITGDRIPARYNLIAFGLAAAALTFVV